jgi:hypothetical protein
MITQGTNLPGINTAFQLYRNPLFTSKLPAAKVLKWKKGFSYEYIPKYLCSMIGTVHHQISIELLPKTRRLWEYNEFIKTYLKTDLKLLILTFQEKKSLK